MMITSKVLRICSVSAVAVTALIGCSNGTASETKTSVVSKLSVEVPTDYTGPDAGRFQTLADPTITPNASFTVGYLGVSTAQPSLVAIQDAIEAEVTSLGGSFVPKDAQLDPQKQVSQMNELLAAGVDAIICSPVFAEALSPSIAQAKEKGIPFVTVIGSAGPEDTVAGAVASISQGFDYSAYRTVKAVADETPGASFATMGLGLPVKVLSYLVEREQFWAEEMGLKYLGNVDSTDDTPSGYSTAASTILTKYPNVDVIAAYNDQSSVALSTTVATQGSDAMVINPSAGQSITGDAIEAGRVDIAYRTPFEAIGKQSAIAAYKAVTEQGVPIEPYIVVPSYIVSADNLDQAVWFD
ncbi:sugar ABC transporter substrate-binding protein [Rhodococcus fascians]|nr:sugar ABC transporter substrate-binding protein [Rhodococcus fascians]MBY4398987.1 sugar ABC transporter substrate-binding protein [Rhodococcus fascians]MBY4408525.1 sugar ABC transporter substrate-binding protein [Rhodococcus fascians]MBY4423564.1 sugar ABC transporter substrate-binding protein [Rhodococcus fascians]MBY4462912.1 sugar ABC transporter substrate-binding protein [Rhodococcus fascians]